MRRQSQNEAIVRLVQAIKPATSKDDESSCIDLARLIIDSQLGGGAPLEGSSQHFALTWQRRIENQLGQRSCQDLEHLYQDLSLACGQEDPDLPPKLMTVLTKCIRKTRNYSSVREWTGESIPTQKMASFPTRMITESTSNGHPMSDSILYEEQQVLRELLYAMQGIDGERIKFYSEEEHGVVEGGPHYEGIRVFSPALYPDNFRSPSKFHPSRLGSGAMDALRICGEAGWLVRRLQRYVDFHLNTNIQQVSGGGGRIARALANSIAQELQDYHTTLSQWEKYLPTWSLRHWLVRIHRHSVLHRLMVLGMLAEAVPTGVDGKGFEVGGGTLLSVLYRHSLHGDPRQKSIVQSILHPTSRPWFHMLYLWTTQGLLPPAWGRDFFVTLQQSYVDKIQGQTVNRQRSEDNKYLWHNKYTLDQVQIPDPGIFDPDLVRPAFVVGKGINYIRNCLNHFEWTLQLEDRGDDAGKTVTSDAEVIKVDDSHSEESNMERLGYHYVADPIARHRYSKLAQTLLQAERLVHSYILQSLRRDHSLCDHLFALKQFMFHGQGDFFSSLLDGLYVEFGCGTRAHQGSNANASFVSGHPVAGVYPQQLLAIMETALRRTNAKDLPAFCLERLKVEMLPHEPGHETSIGQGLFATPTRKFDETMGQDDGEDNRTVWDIFVLDYTVPNPLVAIVHEKAMSQYKLVYSFLFGLRKVEYMLNRTWRQSATLQHALQTMAQNNGLQPSSSVGYAQATILLRKISMTRQAMTHFCVNVKSYCMLEVLEGGWKELLERLGDARTLDEAIHAHDSYLEGICRKTLLLQGRRSRRNRDPNHRRRNTSSNNNNKFRHLFGVLLNFATEFCILQERLFDEALQAADRVAERRREAEQRMTQGQWGFENEQELAEEASFFGLAHAHELAEVVNLSQGFHQSMQSFLEALDAKVNGRSRNHSTSMSVDINDDEDSNQISDPSRPLFADAPGEEEDVDALRFLALQLDHNHYYGLLLRF